MNQLTSVKMTYAQNSAGQIVSIEHVKNGLDCNCTCVGCSGRLVAKKGPVNQWHFSHHQEKDKENCQWNGETEIHFKVKEYFERHKKAVIKIGHNEPQLMRIEFDEVVLEKSLRPTKRIPDVTCYTEGERILIEVKVTHEVDKQKIIDYKKVNATVLEYDFSDLLFDGDVVTELDIERHLSRHRGNWLSISPVGQIAEKFQDHERAVATSLIEKNRKLADENRQQLAVLNRLQSQINSFDFQYQNLYQKMQNANDKLSVTQREIDFAKAQHKESVRAADIAFNTRINQLEHELMAKLKMENVSTIERMREEMIAQFQEDYSQQLGELNEVSRQLTTLKKEVMGIELAIEENRNKTIYLEELEKHLNSELNRFKEKEIEWKKASMANATIKRNFVRLEPDLRAMCRKGGIPWPFSDTLLAELSALIE